MCLLSLNLLRFTLLCDLSSLVNYEKSCEFKVYLALIHCEGEDGAPSSPLHPGAEPRSFSQCFTSTTIHGLEWIPQNVLLTSLIFCTASHLIDNSFHSKRSGACVSNSLVLAHTPSPRAVGSGEWWNGPVRTVMALGGVQHSIILKV